MVDNILLKKFFGPFPKHVTHINNEEMVYLPVFTIPKADHTPLVPKYRVLLNAAKAHNPVRWFDKNDIFTEEVIRNVKSIDLNADIEFNKFNDSK